MKLQEKLERQIKINKFKDWTLNHKDVFHHSRYWYVQNCLETLGVFTWEELKEITEKWWEEIIIKEE